MTTDVMAEQQTQSQTEKPATDSPRNLDPTIQAIIDRARASVPKMRSRATWALPCLSAVLLWASFPPVNWGPLAWVSLVPLILLVRLERPTRFMYTAVYLGGLVFSLATLQWMRLGDASMYPAWIALSIYVAMYFPVFVGLCRTAHQRWKLPLIAAVPVVWVGLELVRAYLMTGFSWYYLGHTQYRWIELIQISDIVGAYGVSFLVAIGAATLAGFVPTRWLSRWKLQPAAEEAPGQARKRMFAVGVCVAAVSSAVVYGHFRRSQADFQAGPRVALVQGNFTATVKHDPNEAQAIFNRHIDLTFRAVQDGRHPDLIVWPETMFRNPLFENVGNLNETELTRVAPGVPAELWSNKRTQKMLATLSKQTGSSLVIGVESAVAEKDEFSHYNSAAFVTPDGGVSGRYDKIHRVPFGEYVPLQDTLPALHRFTPFGPDFGIDEGRYASIFAYQGWRAAPVICFEDTVPHFVRRIINSTRDQESGEKVDFLVNLTNDGWFHGSSELDQHLITAAFRSVEHRLPTVRAVNTGISAFIDGDGVVVEPDDFIDGDDEGRESPVDESGRWRKQLNAVAIHTIPIDHRTSFYTQSGDWFAGGCSFVCAGLLISGFIPRRRKRDLLDVTETA